SHARRKNGISPGKDDPQPVAAQASSPGYIPRLHTELRNCRGMHLVRSRILVCLVDEDTTRSSFRHRHRQLCTYGMALTLRLVGELQRFARARIVDLNVRAFASAACGINEFGCTCAVDLGKKTDPELLAARFENGVLGIGILRE